MLRFAIPFMLAAFTTSKSGFVNRLLKNADCGLFKNVQMRGAQKIDERRRIYRYVEREGDQVQRSRWGFFNSLYLLLVEPFNKPARLDLPRNLVRDELFRIGVLRRGNCG